MKHRQRKKIDPAVFLEQEPELFEVNLDGVDTSARRFYERRGYVNSEPGEDQSLLNDYRELENATS